MQLEKYEGLGNDFLVLVDPGRTSRFDAALAVALCDRHRGLGADGLLRISLGSDGADLFMELRNADGSVAETSGNGMRCAVLAGCDAGLLVADELVVGTIAGRSKATILAEVGRDGRAIQVEMGVATIGRRPEFDHGARRAFAVNIGNPHLVLVGEVDDLSIEEIGPELEVAVVGGQNVELATKGPDESHITVDTWERGAGYTMACGSGSCASVAAMHLAGLAGAHVIVQNPGGTVTVDLAGPSTQPFVTLTGGARRVGSMRIEQEDLASLLDITGLRE